MTRKDDSTTLTQPAYFLQINYVSHWICRDIELNPVRAKMVSHPAEYLWSSYHSNALEKSIELLTEHEIYRGLGKTESQRKKAYGELFKQEIPELSLVEIRDAANKAWVLGSDRFKQHIEKRTGRPAAPSQRGGDRKSQVYRKRINQLL